MGVTSSSHATTNTLATDLLLGVPRTIFIVVEGFQLCARDETRSLLDVIVALDLPKAECFQRRKSRALSMSHLEPGFAEPGGPDKNYEVPDTYIFGEEGSEARSAAHDAVRAAAAASVTCAEEGDYAWLRLYFEEVVWPEAERTREDYKCGKPTLSIDASTPPGREEWLDYWTPQASAFVRDATRQLAQRVVVVGLVGMSCSGKSTAASRLSAALNGRDVPVLCQDDFFKFDQYLTDDCPRKDFDDGHAFKDWETPEAIDFPALTAAIQRAKAEAAASSP